jgi:regulator of sirC expression with transglutaminase-like and TPR domain
VAKVQGELSFQEELARKPIIVAHAALQFARGIAYPDLDVEHYLNRLSGLAEGARSVISDDDPTYVRAMGLANFLFQRMALQGNLDVYSDPRNSFLNEVLDRRLGIPISLSVLYLDLARQLGIHAEGVGLPGHFIVRVLCPDEHLYLDPFHGGAELTLEDCARLVKRTTGYEGPLDPAWLEPPPPREILARMLNNLRNVYVGLRGYDLAIPVVEHLQMVQPDQEGHIRDLGLLHYHNGSLRLALTHLEKYLKIAPNAPDAPGVTEYLQSAARDLARWN